MLNPATYVLRSPNLVTMRPETGANKSRKAANALTTIAAWVVVMPKLSANCGNTGAMMPKPTATTDAAAMSIFSSAGIAEARCLIGVTKVWFLHGVQPGVPRFSPRECRQSKWPRQLLE